MLFGKSRYRKMCESERSPGNCLPIGHAGAANSRAAVTSRGGKSKRRPRRVYLARAPAAGPAIVQRCGSKRGPRTPAHIGEGVPNLPRLHLDSRRRAVTSKHGAMAAIATRCCSARPGCQRCSFPVSGIRMGRLLVRGHRSTLALVLRRMHPCTSEPTNPRRNGSVRAVATS